MALDVSPVFFIRGHSKTMKGRQGGGFAKSPLSFDKPYRVKSLF